MTLLPVSILNGKKVINYSQIPLCQLMQTFSQQDEDKSNRVVEFERHQ